MKNLPKITGARDSNKINLAERILAKFKARGAKRTLCGTRANEQRRSLLKFVRPKGDKKMAYFCVAPPQCSAQGLHFRRRALKSSHFFVSKLDLCLNPALLVILGPTASGKSELAVKLAKKLNGEIISADSRQVYKEMNIGTGKITKKEMQGIPHHLLDVVSPRQKFDVVKYKKLAEKAIEDILRRGKLPIICGGTGFYIQTIVDNVIFPEVKADLKLRKKLKNRPIGELLKMLKKMDKKRFKTVDKKNKRRIIRAIEIAKALGKVPKLKSKPKYDSLQIGIKIDKETLKKNIEKRLERRLKQGMVAEVKKLHSPLTGGVSWKKLIDFGLEYKFVAMYLQEKLNKQEMIEQLKKAIWHYAKRQMTWFKKDKRIIWLTFS